MRARWIPVCVLALGCGGRLDEVAQEDASLDVVPESGFDVPWELRDPPLLDRLEIEPYQTTLFIDVAGGGSKPSTQLFKATLVREDGARTDVSSSTSFTLGDPSVGVFSGSALTTVSSLPTGKTPGVSTYVLGEHGTHRDSAPLTIVQLDLEKDLFFVSEYGGSPDPAKAVIRAIAGKTRLDLRIVLSPKSTVFKDPTWLVKSVRAMAEGDAKSGCAPRATKDTDADGTPDTFPSVEPSAVVCFEVTPAKNEKVSPFTMSGFHTISADLVGTPGDVKIEEHALIFHVPAKVIDR